MMRKYLWLAVAAWLAASSAGCFKFIEEIKRDRREGKAMQIERNMDFSL
jgi:hypothetical protein